MRPLLGADRRTLARQAVERQDQLAKSHRVAIGAEIHRATLVMLDALRRTGSIPALPADHEIRLTALYEALALASVNSAGAAILDAPKGASLAGIERKAFGAFFQRLAQQFIGLEGVRRRITAVAETTRAQIVRVVSRGQQAGDTLDAITSKIETLSARLSLWRGNRIARTEIHGASNYGAHNAAKATGLTLQKEWVSVSDGRVRDFNEPKIAEFDHRRMDGVTVDMEFHFNVPRVNGTTQAIMYPGDPAGHPANVINCRCQSVHVVQD